MDGTTASTELYDGLVERVIEFGFDDETAKEFRSKTGRYPTQNELVSPAHLLAGMGSKEVIMTESGHSTVVVSPRTDTADKYTEIGRKLGADSSFYAKKASEWLYFSAAQEERSLTDTVKETINGINNPRHYTPTIIVHTISPRKYQRPEGVTIDTPEHTKTGEKLYVSSIDFKGFTFSDATDFFTKLLYHTLAGACIETHNEAANVHEYGVDLAEALQRTAQYGNITKADSPNANIYLKPNSSFHVRVDILGTKDEILEQVSLLEDVAREVYAPPNAGLSQV